ncbi:MAG: alpha-glucan family phosphorylase [Syntrophales bacterium]
MAEKDFLFEVSWEVCNKVGGIYTVISTKISEAIRSYGENYYLLGPDLKTNPDFEETDEDCWARIREGTAIKEIPCRFGRWRIPGEPKVILVNPGKKFNKDQLLFEIWEDYGVDSIAGGWDYVEPVMFSYACGAVIETIYNLLIRPVGGRAIAQFHEWMCGAGLLCVKKRVPEIGTVFTTHATILGRTIAGSGIDIYSAMDHISPQREASTYNISAKHSMEMATAREADCFSTVSEITASEAKNFLGRSPDFILPNGLDMESIPDLSSNRGPALKARARLLDFAAKFLRKDFSADTKLMIISGRYEFHNKGIDIFLQALGRLDKELTEKQDIIVFICVLAEHMAINPAALSGGGIAESAGPLITTHRLHNELTDPILSTCNNLGLKNSPQNRVNIIFVPAYLNGHDGLINMTYYEALSGCDLGVFPSYYEPWGYTPLESAAHAVPTITTELAGFGLWVRNKIGENKGVIILKRKGIAVNAVINDLIGELKDFTALSKDEMSARRIEARRVALTANWHDFYKLYLEAYDRALQVARARVDKLASTEYREKMRRTYAGTASVQPHFRTFTAVVNLPGSIRRLRELAYNLWWTWNTEALELFTYLDPKLWEETGNNPVKMLETVSPERLREAAGNEGYRAIYDKVLDKFDHYMADRTNGKFDMGPIKWSSPVAYFSPEFGIHESLPIYSGGLGVLAGDHLKAASDLKIPLVAVGLLYKNGYFRQRIDKDGWQVAEYPERDFSNMPVQIVRDDRGLDVQLTIELPGRTLFANIWEAKVGRVMLYLLDSDVSRNTVQDRGITARLYADDPRTRIEQEILLGMGGVKLLRKLGIRPSVYHINEGHSAFLLFELINNLILDEGLTFDEAKEIVRGGTVFTTHTPVEAGNERFSKDIVEYYFSSFFKRWGISPSQFWELGRKDAGEDRPFFMTVLGLKLSNISNGVSKIHGSVARRMWAPVWKGFHYSDIPIKHITNGVHLPSYISARMKEILDVYLGPDWEKNMSDKERWKRIHNIPDSLLWRVKSGLKFNLVNYLTQNITKQQWIKYGDSKTWRDEIIAKINPAALIIGFARRFAPYKRANLLLSDLDRLDRIVNNEKHPVHIIYAGKAHPSDKMGVDLIKKVIDTCNDRRFLGKIFFLEDYDLQTAKHLLQGVDVWLNTPRRPCEACGTSGQKVVINGGLNLSVSDGWWPEGCDGTNGWTIGPVLTDFANQEETLIADERDAQSMYTLIEDVITPMFYDRDASGIPQEWIRMIKESMSKLVPKFNAERMVSQYLQEIYISTAQREFALTQNGFKLAKELADWKLKTPMRFSSLKLIDVIFEGIHGDTIHVGEPFSVNVRIDPGKLEPEEILAELIVGKIDGHEFVTDPRSIPLHIKSRTDNIITFSCAYQVEESGQYSYGIRIIPFNKNLGSKQELGLALWG